MAISRQPYYLALQQREYTNELLKECTGSTVAKFPTKRQLTKLQQFYVDLAADIRQRID